MKITKDKDGKLIIDFDYQVINVEGVKYEILAIRIIVSDKPCFA
ncbi:hypothetical protein LCGC14_1108290 [marine sediment metagenome]|uniref:Uncharacterized protein n=1 Tax=marine sediment metagenome TaxID=412755 RepID=A0A0F9PQP6_9ZZZZ